ncbi:MAG TPA: PIN domain protein [Phycisphaerae bacterium]|nr:PIN domain protein [Phycisphaerae bacterium]
MDTSVFGGVADEEFAEPSRRFFERVKQGGCIVLVSDVTYRELQNSPGIVRGVLTDLAPESVEEVALDEEVDRLADAYIAAKALGPAAKGDALHVAAATVAGADLILSWNFKHIVNYSRIRVFNSVNMVHAYHLIDIRSPLEMDDESENI